MHGVTIKILSVFYILTQVLKLHLKLKILYCKLNYFDVQCKISFEERLPEDGLNRWPKRVEGCAIYNTINLHICICACWSNFALRIINAWSPNNL